MINPMDLAGKHILITGASQGIGKQTALLASLLGARVTLVARDEAALSQVVQEASDGSGRYYPFDLTDTEKIEDLVHQIVLDCGPLSGMVHCAGIAPMRPIGMLRTTFLHSVMLLNLYSYIELIRCIAKPKNHLPGASIIGISSVKGSVGGKSETAYSASKAAMDAATRSLARELSSKHIRINTIIGGLVKTKLLDQLIDSIGIEALEKQTLERQYLGVGSPDDIANAACFLLSDASKFITGTGFVVDGGYLS